MFSTIFKFEIKRWLNTPTFYIYCFVFFILSIFVMASALGMFDGATGTTSSPIKVNSPLNINGFLNGLSTFVYFLLPTIIGAAVYRDFRYQVHSVLFSYPLTKGTYLSAKFLSALVVTILVVFTTIIGFIVAQYLPGINKDLLGPTRAWAYLQALVLLVIPNLILFGAMVFGLVTFTRNIYVGFIFVLLLFVFQSLLSTLTQDMDNRYLVALLDPFGFEPIQYYTKYWTIEEQNTKDLPFMGVVLYNRLIWLGVAALILGFVYYTFSFAQSAFTFSRKTKGDRVVKDNFGSIIRVKLSDVKYSFSFLSHLKVAWNLSQYDFKYVVRNWTFIVIMVITVLMVLVVASTAGQMYGTETYPVTWKMLNTIGGVYSFFLQILIFLFAGMLIQRAQTDRMNLLIDATAVPNWTMLLSKFFALLKMTCVVLLISMLSAIIYQAYQGYYHFEIGNYVKELFGLDMMKYLILILFALFVQSLFKNYMAGFMVCLFITIGVPMLSKIGVEQAIFKFNTGPGYSYSDMNGYGMFRNYMIYKIYWLLFVLVLTCLTLLFWRRGILSSVKERFSIARLRFKPTIYLPLIVFLGAFLSLGGAIYYHNNVSERYVSQIERELEQVTYERQYKRYHKQAQPRIVDTKVLLDIYPNERNYYAEVLFKVENKSKVTIDTLFINYSEDVQHMEIGNDALLVMRDSLLHVNIYALRKPLMPQESMEIKSVLKNKANTFLKDKSPILENGTFINNSLFPSIGYSDNYELVDNEVRAKYTLPKRDRMADPTDSAALANTYISSEADWIQFETTISTAQDQIALAPGYLIKEWVKDGRRYFHYKMDQKMLNFYSFISARYAVKKEKWNGINLEIYYHKDHTFNLDRMMTSMKKSLGYYGAEFSPYQFQQMRIVEFPRTHGTFAQAFANTVPFSEAIGFIAKVDDDNPDQVDYPYSVTAHELAHQWWAHQVIGANVKGATMLSESLAEYSSLKVLEHTYGKGQMRKYLKEALDSYLRGRTMEQLKENPLMYNENQQYIHYNKGSLVMYAMSDFLGEKVFNSFLKQYVAQVAFQDAPYTTSLEFVDLLKRNTPDSLQYAIKDMYETITLYDNVMHKVTSKKIADNKYQVDIVFNVAKYRADDKGKRVYKDGRNGADSLKAKIDGKDIVSLPLADYVEIGVFAEPKKSDHGFQTEQAIYLKKHKINKIDNKITLFVDKKPFEVGIDPYNKLIDTNSDDNRKRI